VDQMRGANQVTRMATPPPSPGRRVLCDLLCQAVCQCLLFTNQVEAYDARASMDEDGFLQGLGSSVIRTASRAQK
jgi:hypothetical protein